MININTSAFPYGKVERIEFLNLILMVALLPFFLISIYNHPSVVDEYWLANMTKSMPLIDFLKKWYLTGGGRYTASIMWWCFNPLNYENWLLISKIIPVFIIMLFCISVFILVNIALNKLVDKPTIYCFTLSFVVTYFYSIYSVSSAFYWFSGSSVYTIGSILFLNTASSIINLLRSRTTLVKLVFGCLSIFFVIATVGSYEPIMMVTIIVLFLLLVFSFFIKLNTVDRLIILLLFLISLCFALLEIKAPGNLVRAAQTSAYNSAANFSLYKIFISISKSIYFTVTQVFAWVDNLVLILFTILFVPVAIKIDSKINFVFWNPVITILFTGVILSAMAFPSFFTYQSALPRVWDSIYMIFLIGWCFNVFVLVSFLRKKYNIVLLSIHKAYFYSIVLILLSVVFLSQESAINIAYVDFFAKAPEYNEHMLLRYKEIKLNKYDSEALVQPIFKENEPYKYPQTLFTKDITGDKTYLDNIEYAKFFKLKNIAVNN